MSTEISTATMNAPVRAPAATSNVARAQKAGKEFEGVFVSQMLGQMFSGISTDGPFGGGQGEAMFRSLMLDEYGKQISAQGGIGLASHITTQLLKYQEAAGQPAGAPDKAAQTKPTQDKAVPAKAAEDSAP